MAKSSNKDTHYVEPTVVEDTSVPSKAAKQSSVSPLCVQCARREICGISAESIITCTAFKMLPNDQKS